MKNYKIKSNWTSWPIYNLPEKRAVNRVINSNQLFAEKEVRNFEKEFELYNGSKNVYCVGNATQGLHLALAALNIGVGDEVIVTNYSWISSASCILMQNAVPVFCDIEEETLGIDPNKIISKITKRTKAILYVHMFGNPAKVNQIYSIAKKYNLLIIEDASHAHGATYKDIKVGNFSDVAVFSLHQRKNLSCGEGGIVISKKKSVSQKIYKLRSFGAKELSYNYRMTEFSAAIGRERLKILDNENKIRNEKANYIFHNTKNIEEFSFIKPSENCYSSFHKLILKINNNKKIKLKNFLNYMKRKGIQFEKTYPPLNTHSNFNPKEKIARGTPWKWKLYKNSNKLPVSLNKINFPISHNLSLHRLAQIDIDSTVGSTKIHKLINSLKNFLIKN